MDDDRTSADIEYWLTLVHAPGISPIKFRELLDCFKHPREICNAAAGLLAECGLKRNAIAGIHQPDWKGIKADVEWLQIPGNRLISCLAPEYPPLLGRIPDRPPVLFVRGRVELLSTTQIAIVGSRNPTPGGRRIAREFACRLGRKGMTITSGLALGIDSSAHVGALEADAATVAVMGNGLNTVYPAANRGLAERICENGALISEFPVGTPPMPPNFPRRNRIISGLSVGTLVVEAALKSGSLITARLALEQGREVFAIPGSIRNPLTRGCHALLGEGAKLTEKIEDILMETGPLELAVRQAGGTSDTGIVQNEDLDGAGKLLLDHIGYEPVTIDCLIEETGMTANGISVALLNLELQDLIESLPGGNFARKN